MTVYCGEEKKSFMRNNWKSLEFLTVKSRKSFMQWQLIKGSKENKNNMCVTCKKNVSSRKQSATEKCRKFNEVDLNEMLKNN